MRHPVSFLVAIAAVAAVLVAATRSPQNPAVKTIRRHGPYKVVVSKPIPPESWRATSVYTESEHLTAMFNQLEIDQLTPVFVNTFTEVVNGDLPPQDRIMVVCRRK